MADKAISQLNAATSVTSVDLFVLEQSGEAKKLTGQILENWLVSFADGHGGIQSITKTGSTGTNPVIDTYTILLADETTTTFQVVNGIKGDTGDQTYVWIRYAHTYPTADSDMGTSPDEWIGIYSGTSTTAPTHYTDYTWYQFKGETGDTGAAATITAATVGYQQSDSGSVVPEGSWTTTVPSPVAGKFLWTRIQIQFNTGSPITAYSVARYGRDGDGAVSSVNNVSPDQYGNVQLVAGDIQASDSTSIQAHLTDIESDVSDLTTAINNADESLAIVATGNTHAAINNGQYVYVKEHSTLPDGLYRNQSGSNIAANATLTSSNLTAISNGGFNAFVPRHIDLKSIHQNVSILNNDTYVIGSLVVCVVKFTTTGQVNNGGVLWKLPEPMNSNAMPANNGVAMMACEDGAGNVDRVGLLANGSLDIFLTISSGVTLYVELTYVAKPESVATF